MKNTKWYVIFIMFLAVSLRFWQLGTIPASLNWDEVAWGYNAYTLGIDGRDEFGQFLPYKYIESYGDYKPPIYAYFTVLPIKLFGLNEFSTRFISAFFGSLTVLITFFLVKRIFYDSDKKELYALCSTFFLTISPWHINLSRAAFEANVATFFVACGVWLFLAGIQNRKWFLPLSALMFGLSFYTFNSPRIVAPLLVMVLALLFYKKLRALKKEVMISVGVGLFLLLPLVGFLLSPQAKLRYQEVNIFSDVSIIENINQEIQNDQNAFWSKLIHNRRFIYSLTYAKHYFDNLNPAFLFVTGDENHKFSTKDVGQMYFIDVIFLIIGLLFLIRKKEGVWWILPIWFLLALIPASTARETPHALRIEIALPTLQIISAYGFVTIVSYFRSLEKKKMRFTLAFLGLLVLGNFLYYAHGYYSHYGRESAGEWNYGYKDSIAYVKQVEHKYDEVRVTRKLGRPYAYYAFYMKTDPAFFRKTAIVERDVFGFVEVKGYGKYRFADNLESIQSSPNASRILYIDVPEAIPANATIVRTFHYPDGYHRLSAYTL